MKILNVKLNTVSFVKNKDRSLNRQALKLNSDKIGIVSITQEQILLTQEAKVLSKEAYGVFAKGKNVQKQAQDYIKTSSKILSKAQAIQERREQA